MKKLLLGLGIAAIAGPALADTTVEFKRDGGEANVVILEGDGKGRLPVGIPLTYTFDVEALKMCFTVAEQSTCVVFDDHIPEPKVGDSSKYTVSGGPNDGATGVATVTEVTE
ncbi:MAG: hypothetical protein AAF742_03510 [Pseudomonadota bacterium]